MASWKVVMIAGANKIMPQPNNRIARMTGINNTGMAFPQLNFITLCRANTFRNKPKRLSNPLRKPITGMAPNVEIVANWT